MKTKNKILVATTVPWTYSRGLIIWYKFGSRPRIYPQQDSVCLQSYPTSTSRQVRIGHDLKSE